MDTKQLNTVSKEHNNTKNMVKEKIKQQVDNLAKVSVNTQHPLYIHIKLL